MASLIDKFVVLLSFTQVLEAIQNISSEEARTIRRAIRMEMMEKFEKLKNYEVTVESSMITLSVWHLDAYNRSKRIAIYLDRRGEPETKDILADMFRSRKRVYVPRYRYITNSIEMVRIKSPRDLDSLKEGRHGYRQPSIFEKREEALSRKGGLDMIIMPGAAFTRAGRRLGSGRGLMFHYVLKARQVGWPVLVGLAYKHQIIEDFPACAFDLKLDYVLDSVHADHFEDYEERVAKIEAKYKPMNTTTTSTTESFRYPWPNWRPRVGR